jgi:hypothetical protein
MPRYTKNILIHNFFMYDYLLNLISVNMYKKLVLNRPRGN